jgi:hypothetical protein
VAQKRKAPYIGFFRHKFGTHTTIFSGHTLLRHNAINNRIELIQGFPYWNVTLPALPSRTGVPPLLAARTVAG